MSEPRIPIGKVAKAFGIRGQVSIEPMTSFLSRFDAGNIVFIDGKPLKIQKSQMHKGRPVLKLSTIETMSQAEALQWKVLEAEGEPELDDDEFLIEDLIGLKVIDANGEMLGEVDDIEDYPAHQVVVVGEIRIPMVEQFIELIDLEEEIMRVRLIYGMRPGEE